MNGSDRLQTIAQSFVARGGVGIAVALARHSNMPPETAFAGFADRPHATPVGSTHLFKIGSCTKTLVAATLMRLAEQQRVDLDTPSSTFFPWLPGGTRITVRQLVNHRSGLPEFEYDMPMDRVDWTPRQIVEFAFSVRPADEPGVKAVYSNTGYVLAGQVIEAIPGRSLAKAIRHTILDPLGLEDTFCAAGEPFPQDRLACGYYYRPPLAPGTPFEQGGEMWRTEGLLEHSEQLQDSTSLFPFQAAYAAGDMVGTAADVARFLCGLASGRVIGPEALSWMMGDRWPVCFIGTRMVETGAGLFASRYGGRILFGHQGGMPGYVTLMQHDPETGISAAITTNTGSGLRQHFYATGIHDVMDAIVSV
jgi:D-alanyl-D-alanine carboxypeptidase